VIGGVCLLIMAAVATAAGPALALIDVVHSPAPTRARSHQGLSGWGSTDVVPVSLSIQNDGEDDDRLVGASTPIASCVRVQRTRLVRGRPQTDRLPGGLVILAEATMTLEPGGSYLALFGLRADLVQGEIFPLTLYFDRAGKVNVIARVRRRVDAAGTTPLPPVSVGDLTVAHVSAQPALQATPVA
jgi:copper(I)-binding protein